TCPTFSTRSSAARSTSTWSSRSTATVCARRCAKPASAAPPATGRSRWAENAINLRTHHREHREHRGFGRYRFLSLCSPCSLWLAARSVMDAGVREETAPGSRVGLQLELRRQIVKRVVRVVALIQKVVSERAQVQVVDAERASPAQAQVPVGNRGHA